MSSCWRATDSHAMVGTMPLDLSPTPLSSPVEVSAEDAPRRWPWAIIAMGVFALVIGALVSWLVLLR